MFEKPTLCHSNSTPPLVHSLAESLGQSPLMAELNHSIESLLRIPIPSHRRQTEVDIHNCSRLSQFATNEGQRYLHFQTIPRSEMDAYFKTILQSELTRQPMFMPEELQSPVQRDRMVNFIVGLHDKLGFKGETLHLAVSVADRFLSVKNLKEYEYEILGITALWMAGKMEESRIPHFHQWLKMGGGCLEEELLGFETEILRVFDFNLSIPTAATFFNLILTQHCFQERAFFLSHYLLELSLLDCEYLEYKYHVITMAALHLALTICDETAWNEEYFCGFMSVNKEELERCSNQLLQSMVNAEHHGLQEVHHKFWQPSHMRVGQITFGFQKERSLSGISTVSNHSNY